MLAAGSTMANGARASVRRCAPRRAAGGGADGGPGSAATTAIGKSAMNGKTAAVAPQSRGRAVVFSSWPGPAAAATLCLAPSAPISHGRLEKTRPQSREDARTGAPPAQSQLPLALLRTSRLAIYPPPLLPFLSANPNIPSFLPPHGDGRVKRPPSVREGVYMMTPIREGRGSKRQWFAYYS